MGPIGKLRLGLAGIFFILLGLSLAAFVYTGNRHAAKKNLETVTQRLVERRTWQAQVLRDRIENLKARSISLFSASGQRFLRSVDHNTFLKDELEKDRAMIAIASYKRRFRIDYSDDEPRARLQWDDQFRLIRRKNDPARMARPSYLKLNEEFPIDFEEMLQNDFTLSGGTLRQPDSTIPVLRVAFPTSEGRALGVDAFLESFSDVLNTTPSGSLSFVVDSKNRVLLQSHNHFRVGEDLTHLPIVRAARTDPKASTLSYRELPNEPLQLGAYERVGALILVTQVPNSTILAPLSGWKKILTGLFLACFLLGTAIIGLVVRDLPLSLSADQLNELMELRKLRKQASREDDDLSPEDQENRPEIATTLDSNLPPSSEEDGPSLAA